jgi:hypothetical protein
MYVASVVALMLVLPLASIGIQIVSGGSGMLTASLVAKWFVFWMVGVRLLLAGLRQIAQPRYTAEQILGIKDPDATLIVRELGFANTAIGSIGAASLFFRGWEFPIALIGTIFYALAGVNHLTDKHRNKLQSVAMASDLFAAAVLLMLCLSGAARLRA